MSQNLLSVAVVIGALRVNPLRNIRIYHECEGRIEKSVPRFAVLHHEACQVMTNGDPEGRIFLSYPHTTNVCFSCSLFMPPLFVECGRALSVAHVHLSVRASFRSSII